jgi:hypothetical protein
MRRSRQRSGVTTTGTLLLALVTLHGGRGTARAEGGSAAAADNETTRRQALKAFTLGQFDQALPLYVDLFARTNSPAYLREVARCQKKLGQLDRAIDNDRLFLRLSKHLAAADKRDVEADIAEMQAARASGRGPAPAATKPTTSPPVSAAPQPPPTRVNAAPPPAGPPPPCTEGAGGFNFEGSTQGAWTDKFVALALGAPTLDTARAMCGRSSIRMDAHFSPTGRPTSTLHLANEFGELFVKPDGLKDFTGMTVEAGILVDGPADVHPLAFVMLVSDGKWVPGGFVTLTPGRWTVIQHQFGEQNPLGPAGGTATVQRVFKIAVAVQCPSCRAWDGHVNVDAVRWYPGRPSPSVASAQPALAPPPTSAAAPAPVPAAPPAALVTVPLRFWAKKPGQYHVALAGPVSGACDAPCILNAVPGPNTITVSGDIQMSEAVTVPTVSTAVEIKPNEQQPPPQAETPVAAQPPVTPIAAVPTPPPAMRAAPPAPYSPPVEAAAAVPPAPASGAGADLTRSGPVNFTIADAERAEFSGGRYLVELLVSALGGGLALYGVERAVCGSSICLGGALAGEAVGFVVVPPITYAVGTLMGGEGALSSTYWSALASGSLATAIDAKSPGAGIAVYVVLSPILAPLGYEASSNNRARVMKKQLGVTAFAPFVTPLADGRTGGGVAGFAGRF